MSDEAYLRAANRETAIWPAYIYSCAFDTNQVDERVIVYGLYSGAYRNGYAYLVEIEDVELANLLNSYNNSMAALTAQEQVFVSDIASRRYLASLDEAIHAQKLVTGALKITTETQEWDAKMAALSLDEAELDTMAAKVTAEINKTSARITELTAYIEIEGYALAETDIAIAEKSLQSAKMDVEKLTAANAVLKIQLDTIAAATKLVEIDLQIARTKIDTTRTDIQIEKIGLLAGELSIEQAQTATASAELPIAEDQIELARLKWIEVEREITYNNSTLIPRESTVLANKRDDVELNSRTKNNNLTRRTAEIAQNVNLRVNAEGDNRDFANIDASTQAEIDEQRVNLINGRISNYSSLCYAAIQAQEMLAAANVLTTLTHTIKAAT
jgi:hypothetical protein